MNKEDYLAHWGIRGMKWGVRRFQNRDGSLTPSGKKRYGATEKEKKRAQTDWRKDGYTSKATLKLEKKRLRKQKKTGESTTQYDKKLEASKEFDKKYSEVRKNMPKGKKVTNALLSGIYGSHNYASQIASGKLPSEAQGKMLVSTLIAGDFGNTLSASVARKDYIEKKANNW